METNLIRNLLLLCLTVFAVTPGLYAQVTDLRNDKSFFQRKLPEFQQWLRQIQLDHVFTADSIAVSPNNVTLFLRPAFDNDPVCDRMQSAWNDLEQGNKEKHDQFFHERLLHKWAFLAEVREDQASVVVRCHDPAHFYAQISSKQGQIPVEGRNLRSAVNLQYNAMPVAMPPSLEDANTGDNRALIPGNSVGAVCTKARIFLVDFYKPKGTPILWKARIDDSYNFIDEFILEVTHLSNEICPDGYYEYHRIYVKGVQKGDYVELTWEFQGKYGSGILFPPRKNDYKDLTIHYKSDLEEYQKKLFRKLIDYLRR